MGMFYIIKAKVIYLEWKSGFNITPFLHYFIVQPHYSWCHVAEPESAVLRPH